MRLIVSKLGAVLRTAESGSAARGERGETEGLIRHLVEVGHDILYFGGVKGELPCTVIEPHLNGLERYSPAQLQKDLWEEDRKQVVETLGDQWDLYLQVAGSTATYSIDSPTHGSVRDCDVLRTGPAKALAHALGIPTVIINNDPRTYPREQEMGKRWPDSIPIALLDNCAYEKKNGVGGVRFIRRSVHAWTESWGVFRAPSSDVVREAKPVVVAQAHLKTGVRQEGRARGWSHVLWRSLDKFEGFHVYGDGWSALREVYEHNPDRFHDAVGGEEAMNLYANALCSPCVGYELNRSGKAYMIVAGGCIPLLYGDGQDPHTWDAEGLVVPLDHPTRITSPDWELPDPGWLQYFQERFVPRWEVLDAMLDDYERGQYKRDPAVWRERYGGYLEIGRF